jgi:hypothetical protein
MQQAANSTAPARSFTLANALNYSRRSYKEALASLVGPGSIAGSLSAEPLSAGPGR